MKLRTNCKNCDESIVFNKSVSDRAELCLEEGRKIELTCNKCYSKRIYHPNEVVAEKRKSIIITGVLVWILLSILVITFFWKFYNQHFSYLEDENIFSLFKQILALVLIPFIIYSIILNIERKKIKRFNSYRIKE